MKFGRTKILDGLFQDSKPSRLALLQMIWMRPAIEENPKNEGQPEYYADPR